MTNEQLRILGIYDLWDDEDISTERLLAMTCDSANCSVEVLCDALSHREDERTKEEVK